MKETFLAAGGVVGALAASSCCIAPLALVSVGVSGAWIGNLTALAPYQPFFLALAIGCLGGGFWLVYRSRSAACETGLCVDQKTGRLIKSVIWVKAVLWLGATLVALSIGADYGAALLL